MGMKLEGREGRKYVQMVVEIICWQIWKDRCRKVFKRRNPESIRSIRKIRAVIEDLMKIESEKDANKVKNGESINVIEEEWKRPREGWLKVNCDGAFDNGNEVRGKDAGIGVVIRDENGRVVTGVAKKVIVNSSIEAEAAALGEGVMLAESMGILKAVFETDSEILYRELKKGNGEGIWKVKPFIVDILEKKASFEEIQFCRIKRSANNAADWLAKQVKKGMCLTNWVFMPPFSLVHILSRDGLPAPH